MLAWECMASGLTIILNGRDRLLPELLPGAFLSEVLAALELRADRIAVEHNGEIAPRTGWADTGVGSGDKLEVVHFVGGGAATVVPAPVVSCCSKRSQAAPYSVQPPMR